MFQSKLKIGLYLDDGAAKSSHKYVTATLRSLSLPQGFSVSELNARDVFAGLKHHQVIIFPGGQAGPYFRKLGPLGLKLIRRYVENGGTFLGICAGAYFASKQIEFRPGNGQAIVQERNLGFFDGRASGPALRPAEYVAGQLSGAVAAKLLPASNIIEPCTLYFNGGCRFEGDKIKVLARLESGESVLVGGQYGKGRFVLSGGHIEVGAEQVTTTNAELQKVIGQIRDTETQRLRLFKHTLDFLLTGNW